MRSAAIQPKLKMSTPEDKYEREADRIADEVIQLPGSEVGNKAPSVTPVQTRSKLLSTSSEKATAVPPSVQSKIESLQRSGGRPLPDNVRAFMEMRFGQELRNVKFHTGPNAVNLTRALNARAFAIGHNIGFDSTESSPDPRVSARLLAHELAHVLQQQEREPRLQLAPKSKKPIGESRREIAKAVEPIELDLWEHEKREEGYTEIHRKDKPHSLFRKASFPGGGPDFGGINHSTKTVLVGDISQGSHTLAKKRPGEARQIPHDIDETKQLPESQFPGTATKRGGVTEPLNIELQPHQQKTINDAILVALSLPAKMRGYRVIAQEWWTVADRSKEIVVYENGRFLVRGTLDVLPSPETPSRSPSRRRKKPKSGGEGQGESGTGSAPSRGRGSLSPGGAAPSSRARSPTPTASGGIPTSPPKVETASARLSHGGQQPGVSAARAPGGRGAAIANLLVTAGEIFGLLERDPIFADYYERKQNGFFSKIQGQSVASAPGTTVFYVATHEDLRRYLDQEVQTWEDWFRFELEAQGFGFGFQFLQWVFVLPKNKHGEDIIYSVDPVIKEVFQRLEQTQGSLTGPLDPTRSEEHAIANLELTRDLELMRDLELTSGLKPVLIGEWQGFFEEDGEPTSIRVEFESSFLSGLEGAYSFEDASEGEGTKKSRKEGQLTYINVTEKTVQCVWKQDSSQGRVEWRFEGGRLKGTWGYNDSFSDGGKWEMAKK